MAAVHIRNVSDETVARLKERAAAHGRSYEAELRLVLDAAALQPTARRRRQIIWPAPPPVSHPEPFTAEDLYPDTDDSDDEA